MILIISLNTLNFRVYNFMVDRNIFRRNISHKVFLFFPVQSKYVTFYKKVLFEIIIPRHLSRELGRISVTLLKINFLI